MPQIWERWLRERAADEGDTAARDEILERIRQMKNDEWRAPISSRRILLALNFLSDFACRTADFHLPKAVWNILNTRATNQHELAAASANVLRTRHHDGRHLFVMLHLETCFPEVDVFR